MCRSCHSEDGHRRGCPDQPGCRWCGADVDVPDSLCGECQEERLAARAEEAFLARRLDLAIDRRAEAGR